MIPNFFLVGAARSGTTSLDRYLSQHPEIFITRWKEGHFFASDELPDAYKGVGDERLNGRLIRDPDQYARLFDGATGYRAVGESSVFYLCYPGTAERIKQASPGGKILIILRNPVERAYSAYGHLVRDGRERSGFAEGLSLEDMRRSMNYEPMWWYTDASRYYHQVKRFLDVFGPQQIRVLMYEELYAQPQQVLRDVFGFLGVREDVAIDTSVRYNAGGVPKSRRVYTYIDRLIYRPGRIARGIKAIVSPDIRMEWVNRAMALLVQQEPMHPLVRTRLEALFADEVSQLEELLHRDLAGWRTCRAA